MLVTQFEATDARRMFPGWDEPAFKATYSLTVTVPEGFRAVSNMPVAHEEQAGPGLKTVSFGVTPRMSSYLLVLVAGELDRINQPAAGRRYRRRRSQGQGRTGPLRAWRRVEDPALLQ